MSIHPYTWIITAVVLVGWLLFDVIRTARNPHEPSTRECVTHVVGYIVLAGIFGLGVWYFAGGEYAGQFFAGWLTEYSLSIDNLFVFLIIMTRFAVPRKYQKEALLVGIVLALIFRGAFIAAGAALINAFSWVFFLFGAFLLYTAISLVRHRNDDDDFKENAAIRFAKRILPTTDEYHGVKLSVKKNGKRFITPMLIVIIALGSTDVLFALDSIPAIYGLTKEPYLVFTANVFALMGLRQLYFLLGDLLKRLVYLSVGLSVILAFIGVKLILHALHENVLPFINGGDPIHSVPEIPIWLSLAVIVGALLVTTVASLLKSRGSDEDSGTGSGGADEVTSGDDHEDDAATASSHDDTATAAEDSEAAEAR